MFCEVWWLCPSSKITMNDKISSIWGEPTYFAVYRVAVIDVIKFDLPRTCGLFLYLIEFSSKHLECPHSDPIGVYHYGGIRRFIWKNRFWNEICINHRDIANKAELMLADSMEQSNAKNLKVLLDMLELYAFGDSCITNDDNKIFYRVIYRLYEA